MYTAINSTGFRQLAPQVYPPFMGQEVHPILPNCTADICMWPLMTKLGVCGNCIERHDFNWNCRTLLNFTMDWPGLNDSITYAYEDYSKLTENTCTVNYFPPLGDYNKTAAVYNDPEKHYVTHFYIGCTQPADNYKKITPRLFECVQWMCVQALEVIQEYPLPPVQATIDTFIKFTK